MDLGTNTFKEMPSIDTIVAGLSLTSFPHVIVGKECNKFSINGNVYAIDAG